MSIGFDPEAKTWYYRFARDKHRYFKGGFPDKQRAEDAEVKHRNQVIDRVYFPQRVGQAMTFEEGSRWFFENHSQKRKRSWVNDRSRIRILNQIFRCDVSCAASYVCVGSIGKRRTYLQSLENFGAHQC